MAALGLSSHYDSKARRETFDLYLGGGKIHGQCNITFSSSEKLTKCHTARKGGFRSPEARSRSQENAKCLVVQKGGESIVVKPIKIQSDIRSRRPFQVRELLLLLWSLSLCLKSASFLLHRERALSAASSSEPTTKTQQQHFQAYFARSCNGKSRRFFATRFPSSSSAGPAQFPLKQDRYLSKKDRKVACLKKLDRTQMYVL